MVKTYGDLYVRTRDRLTLTESPETAGPMARDLVSTLSGMTQEAFLAERDKPVSEELTARVDMAVDRYLAGEPLPYVLGEWTFYGLDLYVSPDVLIPRDDTCAVAELTIHRGLFLDQNPRILDLCCGSGCIGLAIASRLKDARVTLADLSGPALSVARKNIQRNHMGGRVSCVQVDAMEAPPAFTAWAMRRLCSSPSMEQGPAMTTIFSLPPTLTPPQSMTESSGWNSRLARL